MSKPDARLHAFRPDLADAALQGRVESAHFVSPRMMQVVEPVVSVHKQPRFDAMQLTQALMGEAVKVFAEEEGWAWVQLARDGYVGYVNGNALAGDVVDPTHRVAVPKTFLYPAANLKTQPVITVTMNAMVTGVAVEGNFTKLSNGRFAYTPHLKPANACETDFVAVAQRFLEVPYYWGGKSALGIDCSGLVQLALEACGVAALRDSDMQEETLGERLMVNDLDTLKRGDLVFWKGHVGIMTDAETLLHANGHHMMVAAEPLKEAVARIAAKDGQQVTAVRRLG